MLHAYCVYGLFRKYLRQSAARAVPKELVRFSRKEGQSAVMIAYYVQQARSVMYQVNRDVSNLLYRKPNAV